MTLPTHPVPDGAPTEEALTELLVDYAGFRCIGSGAMGVVYEAHHEPLDRKVAVKVLSPSALSHPKTVERFFREARSMARITHPHIVQVYDVGGEGVQPFFAMEIIEGGSLKDRIAEEGPLPPRIAAQIARDIAEGLVHAQHAGVLHRDVKPGNVLLDLAGRAHLTDFGLVRNTDSATLTASDAIVGTPQFMSPEQVRGDTLDGRSDMFSLGATLYEALSGASAFQGDAPMVVLRAICEAQPTSLRKLRPEIPVALEAIVMRMLEKEPGRRYESLEACRDDLDRYLNGEAVEATLPNGVTRAWRRLRSNRLATRFAAASLVLGAIVVLYVINENVAAGESARRQIIQSANTAIQAGHGTEAMAILEELSEGDRSSSEILLLNAQAAEAADDPGWGLYFVDRVLATEPENEAALALGCELAGDSGEYGRLEQYLDVREGLAERRGDAAGTAAIALERVRVARMQVLDFAQELLWYERARAGEFAALHIDPAVLDRRLLELRARSQVLISTARGLHRRLPEEVKSRSEAMVEMLMLGGLEIVTARPGADRKAMIRRRGRIDLELSASSLISSATLVDRLAISTAIMSLPEAQEVAREDEWQESAEDLASRYGAMLSTAELAMDAARAEAENAFRSLATGEPTRGPLGRATNFVGGLVDGLFGSGDRDP